jgi:hypothetical protein
MIKLFFRFFLVLAISTLVTIPNSARSSSLSNPLAPFVQVFAQDGEVWQILAQPGVQMVRRLGVGKDPAVVELPGGGFITAWSASRCVGVACYPAVDEIHYTIHDRYGQQVLPVTIIDDLGSPTYLVQDRWVTLAAAPDGRIGLLWQRYQNKGTWNGNIYFAVLNPQGSLLYGPANLTASTAWCDEIPYGGASIVATTDNRFMLAWNKYSPCETGESGSADLYTAVYSSSGASQREPTRFSVGAPGTNKDYAPSLTAMSDNRVLMTWTDRQASYFAVLSSNGGLIEGKTQLSHDSMVDKNVVYTADAVELPDAKIFMAWYEEGCHATIICHTIWYSVFNPNASGYLPPQVLYSTNQNPVFPAVTFTPSGQAVVTWVDQEGQNGPGDSARSLFYALVSSEGEIQAEPRVFFSAESGNLLTGWYGFDLTSYRSPIIQGVDGAVWFQNELLLSTTAEVTIPIHFANFGVAPAVGAVLTISLEEGLEYLGDSSGITPQQIGSTLYWKLADLTFLEVGQYELLLRLPADSQLGRTFVVSAVLAAPGDLAELNNADDTLIIHARNEFLPALLR